MKMKLILSLIAVLFVAVSATYASFPVQRATPQNTTVTTHVEKQQDELTSPAVMGGGKSQWVALFLCAFVGTIGVHRFYLGYIWQGVVQILTFGGCGIWSLIDLIRIITGDLEPKDGSYGSTI